MDTQEILYVLVVISSVVVTVGVVAGIFVSTITLWAYTELERDSGQS